MEQRSTPMRGGGPRKLSAGRQMERDISESLGKRPPQAPDLEAAILGALMLEKYALDEVIKIIKPHDFYVEAHKIIYEAILNLRRDGNPIDMKTVVAELRKVGKLELVEGAHKIVELTDGVVGSANIVYHARIVIEMSLKRSLIELASGVHTEAYDDTTDVFELLDRVESQFKTVRETRIGKSVEDKIKDQWETRLITEDPHEPPPLIMIDGCPVVMLGNHTLVVGKKKARKTLFMVGLIGGFVKDNPLAADSVLIFDTEQGKKHVYAIRQKIRRLAGVDINVFYLRGMHYRERVTFIIQTIRYWRTKVRLVILDGVRDLIGDILDSEESLDLIYEIERLQLEHELAIINVLHLNKTDGNARGHLGTELANKAIATIELTKDPKTGVTIVHCESSRDRPFEDYAFTHGAEGTPEEGLPVGANMPKVEQAKAFTADPEDQKKLETAFEGGILNYKEACTALQVHFQMGHVRARQMLAALVRNGQVLKNGKDRDPKAQYKLISVTPPKGQDIPTRPAVMPAPEPDPGYDPTEDLPF